MDSSIVWLQPEQKGPSSTIWLRVWRTLEFSNLFQIPQKNHLAASENDNVTYDRTKETTENAEAVAASTPITAYATSNMTADSAIPGTIPSATQYPFNPLMTVNGHFGPDIAFLTPLLQNQSDSSFAAAAAAATTAAPPPVPGTIQTFYNGTYISTVAANPNYALSVVQPILLPEMQSSILVLPSLQPSIEYLNNIAVRKRKNDNCASTFELDYYSHEIHGKFGGHPWLTEGVSYRGIEGLHDEIEDFYRWMQPNAIEAAVRNHVVKRVEAIILTLWPNAEVQVYGSFQTGLYLPTSDIDLAIIGYWNSLPLRFLEKVFVDRKIAKVASIKVLERATVPIIKLIDKETEIRVDISFNMTNGLKSANLMKDYKAKYPVLQKLVYVLKQFLLQRDLNEVFTGGISSYSLILMCISFLQMHPNQDYVTRKDEKSLGVLLMQFLELYGCDFNYMKYGIKIVDGGSLIKREQNDNHRSQSALMIEDPLDPKNDIGRSSYGFLRVRKAFDYAYNTLFCNVNDLCDNSPQFSILSRIIRIADEVITYRHWLIERFHHLASDVDESNNRNRGSTSDLFQIAPSLPNVSPSSETESDLHSESSEFPRTSNDDNSHQGGQRKSHHDQSNERDEKLNEKAQIEHDGKKGPDVTNSEPRIMPSNSTVDGTSSTTLTTVTSAPIAANRNENAVQTAVKLLDNSSILYECSSHLCQEKPPKSQKPRYPSSKLKQHSPQVLQPLPFPSHFNTNMCKTYSDTASVTTAAAAAAAAAAASATAANTTVNGMNGGSHNYLQPLSNFNDGSVKNHHSRVNSHEANRRRKTKAPILIPSRY